MIEVEFSFLLPLILSLVIIMTETVEGGKCLQDAQLQCQTESAGLIDAQRQRTGVCSAYADYDSCIKTSIAKLGCRLSPTEADLYKKDITDIYTEYPHGCTKSESGWIASYTARSAATGGDSENVFIITTLGFLFLIH